MSLEFKNGKATEGEGECEWWQRIRNTGATDLGTGTGTIEWKGKQGKGIRRVSVRVNDHMWAMVMVRTWKRHEKGTARVRARARAIAWELVTRSLSPVGGAPDWRESLANRGRPRLARENAELLYALTQANEELLYESDIRSDWRERTPAQELSLASLSRCP